MSETVWDVVIVGGSAGVPIAMSAGCVAGAVVNMALVSEEFEAAVAELAQGAA
jgi:hypothetical protein